MFNFNYSMAIRTENTLALKEVLERKHTELKQQDIGITIVTQNIHYLLVEINIFMSFLNEYVIKEFLESKYILKVFSNFSRELKTGTFEKFFILSSKDLYSLA